VNGKAKQCNAPKNITTHRNEKEIKTSASYVLCINTKKMELKSSLWPGKCMNRA
jgi:hypothetical protein